MTKSKEECLESRDWVSALERFEQTTKRWKNHWLDCLMQLYEVCEDFAKEYIIDPIEKTVEKVKAKVRKARASKYDEVINSNGYDITTKGSEICYLFEFYDDMKNLICSKVGTTTRTVKQRLTEELRSKTYKEMGATNAVVNRVYNCGEYPAEGLESLIRSQYIKKYPKSFKKNDRFIGEVFDFDLCDKIAESYLA